ncbi:hypothetical protein ACFE04_009617 [Oxalis oulophora]
MDAESLTLIEKILREDALLHENLYKNTKQNVNEWKTVSYKKNNRKYSTGSSKITSDDRVEYRIRGGPLPVILEDGNGSVEVEEEEEKEKVGEYEMPVDGVKVEDDQVKKVVKVIKKVKVSVGEAAGKIEADHLLAFLVDITDSYETHQDHTQLMRFTDYIGRAFVSVSPAQFPWFKMLKESTVTKMADIPLSHIGKDVYKIAVDWISKKSNESLELFALWSLNSLLGDQENHEALAKGSKKFVQLQQVPTKFDQVAIFVVLAMVLRQKPDVMFSLFPILKYDPKYQGPDKLPLTIWMIAQVSQGDLVMGLLLWVRLLLPMLTGNIGSHPQSRDLILQSVERILSSPKARQILINGAVRKGKRVVPPSALEMLMRITFGASSAKIKATDQRFEAIYPTLKEISLSGSSGKAMNQVAEQMLNFAIKAAGEGMPELSAEASSIVIWCLVNNPACYKQWDVLYMDNLEASGIVLRMLVNGWKEQTVRHQNLEPLRETLKSFSLKNAKVLSQKQDDARVATVKEAEKYRKIISGQFLGGGGGCMKGMLVLSAAIGLGAAIIVMYQNLLSPWELSKPLETFSST